MYALFGRSPSEVRIHHTTFSADLSSGLLPSKRHFSYKVNAKSTLAHNETLFHLSGGPSDKVCRNKIIGEKTGVFVPWIVDVCFLCVSIWILCHIRIYYDFFNGERFLGFEFEFEKCMNDIIFFVPVLLFL